jgi:hypothetical protein
MESMVSMNMGKPERIQQAQQRLFCLTLVNGIC